MQRERKYHFKRRNLQAPRIKVNPRHNRKNMHLPPNGFPWKECNIYDILAKIHLLCSRSVMSDSLGPHGLQPARLPHLPLSLRVSSDSCPLNQWCHPTVLSSVGIMAKKQWTNKNWETFNKITGLYTSKFPKSWKSKKKEEALQSLHGHDKWVPFVIPNWPQQKRMLPEHWQKILQSWRKVIQISVLFS